MTHSPLRFIPSIAFKRRPIHLTFFVTDRCNQRCPFCFYLGPERSQEGRGPELSLDEIEKISSSMGDLLWLAFSGGEIFLRDDIADISRVFYENNRPSIMLYPTNGMLAGLIEKRMSEILDNCKKSTIVVKLSIDGIGEKHDALRGTHGSFEKTLETYEALSGLLERYPNFELGVNTVFCSANQDEMDGTIEFVRGLDKIKTHTISLVRGDSGDERYKRVDLVKYMAAAEKLERNMKNGASPIYGFSGARLKAAQDILQRRMIYKTLTERRRQTPCFAGRLNLVLTERGDVFPCESFDKKMGNLKDFGYDMDALIKEEAARKIISSIEEDKCRCSHECYYITNILFNPKTYPSLLREYLSLRAD